MLYVSAAFMFLFLPLTLGAYTLVSVSLRKYVLLFSGVLFYVFANLGTPLAIPILAAVVTFTYITGKKLARTKNKIFFLLLIAFYVAAFAVLRIIYETNGGSFIFPLGAAVYLFMSISYLMDIRRGDCEPGSIVDSLIYLTFFPVMAAGPLIKYKDFKKNIANISFNTNNFAQGARLFTTGFIEVLAVSAVLTETYKNILGISGQGINALFGLLAMTLAFLAAYFALAGWTDMGVGLSHMFGIIIGRDCAFAPAAYSPSEYFSRILKGFGSFLDDYLVTPMTSSLGKNKRIIDALGAAIKVFILSLWIKTSPTMFAAALIVALMAALFRVSEADKMLIEKKKMRFLGWLFSTILMMFFWSTVAFGNQYGLFGFFNNLSFTAADFRIYYVNIALYGGKFVAVAAAALLLLVPLSYYSKTIISRVPKKIMPTFEAFIMILLLSVFVFTILFFMPQYPFYASRAFDYMVF